MILKDMFEIIVSIFIIAIPISLIVLVFTDLNELTKKIQNINKKK